MNKCKKYFLLFLVTTIFANCKSGTSAKPGVESATLVTPISTPAPQVEQLKNTDQLTFTGDNHYAQISEDNTKVLYASRLRTPHREFQIYEISLAINKEDRLTFNDGTAIKPVYGNDKAQVYFASSTDESKELNKKTEAVNLFTPPFAFYDPSNFFNGLEIYFLSLEDRKNIPERLTDHQGYDNDPQQIDNNQLSWIQYEQQNFKLQKWIVKNKKTQTLFQQTEPIWSPSWNNHLKEWVWISWTLNTVQTFVYKFKDNSTKPELLTLPEGLYHDVSWAANERQLILSARLQNKADFDIYIYDFQEKCLKPIISSSGDDIEPTINKKNSFIVFSHRSSANNGNHFQLYKKSLSQAQEPCISAAN